MGLQPQKHHQGAGRPKTAGAATPPAAKGGRPDTTARLEATLPFELLGFDADNSSEFLNWHLLRDFQ